MKFTMIMKNNKGSVVSDFLLFILIIIFVVIPLFSSVFEQYVLLLKGQAVKDAIDITNLAAYNAMTITEKSENIITAAASDIKANYIPILALNMNLNSDLTPKENSIADGTVEIINITVYSKGMSFPITCPKGSIISRPSIHSIIKVPMKPSLYWNIYRFITGAIGDGMREYNIHVDTELPVNNPE